MTGWTPCPAQFERLKGGPPSLRILTRIYPVPLSSHNENHATQYLLVMFGIREKKKRKKRGGGGGGGAGRDAVLPTAVPVLI